MDAAGHGPRHGLRYVVLRYFNVAGADPAGRAGQSTPRATHLIKVACQAALGQRPYLEVYGTDFPHARRLLPARLHPCHRSRTGPHRGARPPARGGDNLTLNCGYGQGYSVLEVVETVKRVSGVDFEVRLAPRRAGDPAAIVATGEKVRDRARLGAAFDDLETIVSPRAGLGEAT